MHEENEPRFPVLLAVITSWLLPATTATRTQYARLLSVWLLHVAELIAAFFLIATLVAISESKTLGSSLAELQRELDAETAGAVWTALFVFTAIEGAHLVLALALTAWGARDEPLRNSFKNSLRQTWLHTAHFLPTIATIGAVAIAIVRAERHWHQTRTGLFPPQPWYVHNMDTIIATTIAFATLWILWALARATSATRTVRPISRPPTCTACGYNLTTMSMENRCPECGQLVADSLDTNAQPGAKWEHRKELGHLFTWRDTTATAITSPTAFGRRLRIQDSNHRSFLAMHLPIIFLIGGVSLLTVLALISDPDDILSGPTISTCIALVFGSACAIGAFLVANLIAGIAGLFLTLQNRRNLIPAAIQSASYLAPYLLIWEISGAALMYLVLELDDNGGLEKLQGMTGVYRDMCGVVIFLVPNIIAAGIYFNLVWRTARAARYANK